MAILWRPAMAIDNGIIDHDHQVLISIINDFCEVVPSIGGKVEMERTLAKLHHYTNTHLEREEHLQAAVCFPQRKNHHDEHRSLVRQLDAISNRVADLDARVFEAVQSDSGLNDLAFIESEDAKRFLASFDDIKMLLRRWLVEHILKSDLPLKTYVEAMRPHAATMPSIWRAESALLAPNLDTPQAAKNALQTAKAWMPAAFRKERQEAPLDDFDRTAASTAEHAVIAWMHKESDRIGFPVKFDPDCRNIADRALKDALTVWQSGLSSHGTPPRSGVTHASLITFKENTALFERITSPTGRRYLARKVGPKFARLFGEISGRILDEVYSPQRLLRWNLMLDGVLEFGAPLRGIGLANAFGRDDLVVESLLAPFHDHEKKTAEVLVVMSYESSIALPETVS